MGKYYQAMTKNGKFIGFVVSKTEEKLKNVIKKFKKKNKGCRKLGKPIKNREWV